MRVLVACERSGIVRRAFAALGHDAWSCDLAPAEDGSNRHVVGDARELLGGVGPERLAHVHLVARHGEARGVGGVGAALRFHAAYP